MYLELLQRSLTHSLYSGSDAVGFTSRSFLRRKLLEFLRTRKGIVPVRILPEQEQLRAEGKDWPMFAQTMIGVERLRNVRRCVEAVIAEEIEGDLIEAGVWRGGAAIFMRGVLKAHRDQTRCVWVADSFEGLPPPDTETYPADAEGHGHWHEADHLAVSVDEVRANFARYGLLDHRVKFLKGWFSDTLPTLQGRRWAVVRLDGDMYESTMDGLDNLYGGLVPGGFLIIDDYQIEECRRAVDDFRRKHHIAEPIQPIDWTGVYWRRDR